MDIQEIINYSKNKIEADYLTKQVRSRIKETAWDKQNKREGFSETFKPLISQFEKPEDPKKKNIFTQNQETLRNQLALTEGLRDNQRAITQGFEQFERLGDMRELPQIEDFDGDNQKQISKDLIDFDGDQEQEQKEKVKILDIEKGFDQDELYSIEKYGFQKPNDLLNLNTEDLTKNLEILKEKLKSLNGKINGRSNKQNPTKSFRDETKILKFDKDTLKKYKKTIIDYRTSLSYQKGMGINFYFSPQELLKRFKLLGGSLASGNNGVLSEYIQIAHRLRDLGVITNNQLNKLLKSI